MDANQVLHSRRLSWIMSRFPEFSLDEAEELIREIASTDRLNRSRKPLGFCPNKTSRSERIIPQSDPRKSLVTS